MVVNKIIILTEDIFGNASWKEVSQVNLGSLAKPNKQILQVKILT